MTQIKWKAAFLAFLLASSLHSIYIQYRRKRRHHRHTYPAPRVQHDNFYRNSENGKQVFYNHKGCFHHTPSIGILVFPDEEDEPLIGLSRPKALASYTEAKAKRDESFYRHGILAMIRDGKKWGLIGTDGTVLLPPTYKFLIPEKDGLFKAGDKKKRFTAD